VPPRQRGFSLGCAIDAGIRDAVDTLNNADAWYPAIQADGDIREGAGVAEATDLVDLSKWPAGTRLIPAQGTPASRRAAAVHRCRWAPGHRVSHRHPDGVVAGQLAGLELRLANTPAWKTGSAKPRPPG
jgi:hypothetical protein